MSSGSRLVRGRLLATLADLSFVAGACRGEFEHFFVTESWLDTDTLGHRVGAAGGARGMASWGSLGLL